MEPDEDEVAAMNRGAADASLTHDALPPPVHLPAADTVALYEGSLTATDRSKDRPPDVATALTRIPQVAERQVPGKWTTPFVPKVRYTVRFHVVGEDRDQYGSVRGADRCFEVRIVTPHGESTAVALAALHFAKKEPKSVFSDVSVTETEEDFTIDTADYRDRDSLGR